MTGAPQCDPGEKPWSRMTQTGPRRVGNLHDRIPHRKTGCRVVGNRRTCCLLALSVEENRLLENRPGRPHLHPRRCRRLCPKPTRGGGLMVYRRKGRIGWWFHYYHPEHGRQCEAKCKSEGKRSANLEGAQLKSELARQFVPVAIDDFEA